MDALERAREAMARGVSGALPEHLNDFYFVQAQAYAAIAQAESLERIAMHLGNIHQTLITPNADREPVTAADQLKRIADVLEASLWTDAPQPPEGREYGRRIPV